MYETIETGAAQALYPQFGDTVRIGMLEVTGRSVFGAIGMLEVTGRSVFGAIEQRVEQGAEKQQP